MEDYGCLCFGGLPLDVIKIINSFLGDRSRRTMRAINTTWHQLIKYDTFTFYSIRSADLPALVKLARYDFPLNLHFTKLIAKPDVIVPVVSNITNLISLSFDEEILEETDSDLRYAMEIDDVAPIWLQLTRLTNLTSLRPDSLHSNPNLIARLSKLERIKLSEDLTVQIMNGIISLETTNAEDDIHIIELPQFANPSQLTSLTLVGKELSEIIIDKLPELTALQHLHCEFTGRHDYDWANHTRLTNLEIHAFEFPKNVHVLENLRRLKWESGNGFPNSPTFDNCQGLSKLTSLEINGAFVSEDQADVLQYFPASLEVLDANLNGVELRHIQPFTNLKSLSITIGNDDFLPSFETNLTHLHFRLPTQQQLRTVATLTNLKSLSCDFNCQGITSALLKGTLDKLPYLEVLQVCDYLMPDNYLPPTLTRLNAALDSEQGTFNIFLELTRLKYLSLWGAGQGMWGSISRLTTLEYLSGVAGTDEELQCLTALQNLKTIGFSLGDQDFDPDQTRYYFVTALSNLQEIAYEYIPYNNLENLYFLQVPREELNKHLPYLYKIRQDMV